MLLAFVAVYDHVIVQVRLLTEALATVRTLEAFVALACTITKPHETLHGKWSLVSIVWSKKHESNHKLAPDVS